MSEPSARFEVSPVRFRPRGDGSVTVRSGDIVREVPVRGAGEPRGAIPTRPKVPPTVGRVGLRRAGVTIVERQSGGLAERPAEQVDRLRTLIEEHGEADTVHFYASTDALAPEEASWVSEVADQLGMQVDVHLHDG